VVDIPEDKKRLILVDEEILRLQGYVKRSRNIMVPRYEWVIDLDLPLPENLFFVCKPAKFRKKKENDADYTSIS
jgi:hypothetical protein